MVYVYALIVLGDQQEAFRRLLLQKSGRKKAPKAASRAAGILKLLLLLVKQKRPILPERGQRNVNLISEWLQATSIPHSKPYLTF